jgi:hypothetical protein
MQTATTNQKAVAMPRGECAHVEPLMKMRKRIGSTVYEVHMYFNQDAKETMDDKIIRLISGEARSAASNTSQRALPKQPGYGIMGLPQMNRPPERSSL